MPRRDWTARTALCAECLPMTHSGMRASNETTIIDVSYNYIVDINIGYKEVNNSQVQLTAPSIINKDGFACGRHRHSSKTEGRKSSVLS